MKKQYVYQGAQPYEDTSMDLHVEPSLDGTLFEAEFDADREAALLASRLIRLHVPSRTRLVPEKEKES